MKMVQRGHGSTVMVPLRLKQQIASLLNQAFNTYLVEESPMYSPVEFKRVFKASLYVLLDAQYHKRKVKS